MKKGVLYTLEAIIGGLIILSSLVLIYIPQSQQIEEDRILKELGFGCLKYLDDKGLLRYYFFNDNSTLINELESCIKIAGFSLSSENLSTNKTVVTVEYLIAGEKSFNPMFIKLYMWPK